VVKALQVSVYVGFVEQSEQILADAWGVLGEKHEPAPEVARHAERFARWADEHRQALRDFEAHYGRTAVTEPEEVRSALFHGVRSGGMGLLRDLNDMGLLVSQAATGWHMLRNASRALGDESLGEVAAVCERECQEQLRWVHEYVDSLAASILTESENAPGPATPSPTVATLPERIWAPASSALLVLLVGLIAWAAKMPLLFPSLGTSAFLQAKHPAHPASRWYNVVVGHGVGITSGFVAVAVFGAWDTPAVGMAREMALARAGAGALAVGLTLLLLDLLDADHPPSVATTLTVALGAFSTAKDGVTAMAGAVLVATVGALMRRWRLRASRPSPAPALNELGLESRPS